MWEDVQGVLEWPVYGNDVQRWAVAVAVAFVVFVGLRLAKAILMRRARTLADRFASSWGTAVADVFQNTKLWFLLIIALYGGSLLLVFPEKTGKVIESVTIVALLLQAAIWGNSLLTFSISRYVRQRMESDAASVTTITAIGFLSRLALWTIVVLLALENVGIDVTALVAGLGIGGIAVALAAQNILGDLFASLSIVLDKPFVLGDFIIVGDQLGTVEKIGLKTTRLRSLSGEQLIFSNNDLLQSRIRNYKRMQERRVLFSIGVTYQTPYEKLVAIPAMLREAVQAQEQIRFDRAHFKDFGASSLNYEVVYFVLSANFNVYMDIQQAINLLLVQRFEEQGIDFAYPTQTLFLYDTTPKADLAAPEETGNGRNGPSTNS
jgi:small-conductance mechanosensitive channel